MVKTLYLFVFSIVFLSVSSGAEAQNVGTMPRPLIPYDRNAPPELLMPSGETPKTSSRSGDSRIKRAGRYLKKHNPLTRNRRSAQSRQEENPNFQENPIYKDSNGSSDYSESDHASSESGDSSENPVDNLISDMGDEENYTRSQGEINEEINTLKSVGSLLRDDDYAEDDESYADAEDEESSYVDDGDVNALAGDLERMPGQDLGRYPMEHGDPKEQASKMRTLEAKNFVEKTFEDAPERQTDNPPYNPSLNMSTNTFVFTTFLAREKCNVAYEDIEAAERQVVEDPRKHKPGLLQELGGIKKQIKDTRDDFTVIAWKEFKKPIPDDLQIEMKRVQDSFGHLDLMAKNCRVKASETIYNNDIILPSYPHRTKVSTAEKFKRRFQSETKAPKVIEAQDLDIMGGAGQVATSEQNLEASPERKTRSNFLKRGAKGIGNRLGLRKNRGSSASSDDAPKKKRFSLRKKKR